MVKWWGDALPIDSSVKVAKLPPQGRHLKSQSRQQVAHMDSHSNIKQSMPGPLHLTDEGLHLTDIGAFRPYDAHWDCTQIRLN